jgi:hypothetical protein
MRRALCPYMQYSIIVRTVMRCVLHAAIGVCACARICCFVSCMYDARECGRRRTAQFHSHAGTIRTKHYVLRFNNAEPYAVAIRH